MRVTGLLKTFMVVGFGFNVVLGSALLPRQDRGNPGTPAVGSPNTAPPAAAESNNRGTTPAPPPPSSIQDSPAPSPTKDTPADELPPLGSTLVTSAQGSGATNDADSTATITSDGENSTATPSSEETEGNTFVPVPTGFDSKNNTLAEDPNGLPFTPVISPAMAVAGVIFLITGVPFTLVGIRYKRLHIFISTCYLSALSVAVLIIYVMNPPVSNALQGGYLVACTFTGLLIGGLSMVFPEILESLGYLLGGFCISMWFLTLKADGLISTVIGKVAFILCISLLMWSVALLSIIKRGGLIFAISFAGATIVVLGIDCFTRAGMKEFWLYIWDLNDNIFPFGRDHFPHTRGIRVEIAAIVIITIIGVVSQAKLWKLIQERREEWRDRKKKRPISSLGNKDRSVETKEGGRQREVIRWDSRYSKMPSSAEIDQLGSGIAASSRRNSRQPVSGTGRNRDSGIGSDDAQKSRTSVMDVNSANNSTRNVSIPMLELDIGDSRSRQRSPAPSSRKHRNSNRDLGDEIEEIGAGSRSSLAPGSTVVVMDNHTQRSSHQSGTHTIVIPKEEDEDDRSSVATGAASTPRSERNSRHLSVQSLGDLVKNKAERQDDDNSSLAVTMDLDETSEDNLPLVGSEPGSPRSRRTSMLSLGGHNKRSSIAESIKRSLSGRRNSIARRGSVSRSNSTRQGSQDEKSDFLKPFEIALPSSPSIGAPESPVQDQQRLSVADSSLNVEKSGTQNRPASRVSSRNIQPLRQESLQDVRPPSRLVKTFRAAEWAKHLDDAEEPEIETLDYLEGHNSPIISRDETAAPVDFAGLQQGISAPHVPAPPPPAMSRSASRATVDNRYQTSSPLPRSPTYPTSPSSPTMPTLAIPSTSLSPVLRQDTMSPPPPSVVMPNRTSLRSSSTPMISEAIVDSPIQEMRAFTPSPMPVYANDTLLDKRESMLRSTPNLLSSQPAIPTYAALHSSSTTSLNNRASSGNRRSFADDEMSKRNMPMQNGGASRPRTAAATSPRISSSGGFQSRPSTRQGSAAERERQKATLQQWRESMRHDQYVGQHGHNIMEDRRVEMINERQVAAQYEKQRELAALQRDSYLQENMKQRDMQELHRQAMRKMQAGAKVGK